MRFIDGFRDPHAAHALVAQLQAAGALLPASRRPATFMEVCGSHTMAIARYAIRDVLPDGVNLVSGPGCPVCVTPAGYIDAAVALANQGHQVVTFGDMLNVPGSQTSLAEARSRGADIHVVYTPQHALSLAQSTPERQVIFLAIGFETTVAPVVSLVPAAERLGLKNLSLLTAFKTVPAALDALIDDPDISIHGFLCPAHVSAIIGADAYRPYAETRNIPCVVAGFEPLDILLGLVGLIEQVTHGTARVDNQYSRVVTPGGNRKAQHLIATYLEPITTDWRGLGTIPGSGLGLIADYRHFDAAHRFGVTIASGTDQPGCRCGDVVKGKLSPMDCPLFNTTCRPDAPVGPCMVSSEGTCAAWFKYARLSHG